MVHSRHSFYSNLPHMAFRAPLADFAEGMRPFGRACRYHLRMEDVLCDISAFRFHRVPPQVLMLLPPVPSALNDGNRLQLASCPLVTEALRLPVHLLCERKGASRAGDRVAKHVWRGERPIGALQETPMGISVTSPLFTLLTMAPSVSFTQLVMAIYEFCGTFSVYSPTPFAEELLSRAYREHALDPGFGWARMASFEGKPTNMWHRPPLIELDELRAFSAQCEGMRGSKKFRLAASMVTGICASVLEVQESMLFAMPRSCGGEGLSICNNIELELSKSARRISGARKRVGDIVVYSDDGLICAVVECQGQAFHGSPAAMLADSDRTTALQAMGYEVILTTYSQMIDPKAFETVTELLYRKIGKSRRPKTQNQKRKEAELRRQIFVPWELL